MNVAQALEHANAFSFPELLYASGPQAMDAERHANEEAIVALKDAFFAEKNPGFAFSQVLELADRNRQLCDQIGWQRLRNLNGSSLARSLSDDDIAKGIAVMQGRKARDVMRETRGDRDAFGVAYVSQKLRGTVMGIDIETTDRYPDRGYILNVGWEFMRLETEAEPFEPLVEFCGLPERYRDEGVPLQDIHHITWDMIDGHTPFRENKGLQKLLLTLMTTYPYMAHNAAFEDSWFTLHLDGYAEARKAGKITVIDSRDICRRLDSEVASLPRESSPAALENWARRRGTLKADEKERHLGLDDTDLMLRTVHEEFGLKNMYLQ